MWFVKMYVVMRGDYGTIADLVKSDRIEILEKERSWREEEFDIVLQYLRTILLKRTELFYPVERMY